jgi:hypothetical protein
VRVLDVVPPLSVAMLEKWALREIVRFIARVLETALTLFTLSVVLACVLCTGRVHAAAAGRCEVLFATAASDARESTADLLPLLRMKAEYRGEDRGLYTDPLTHVRWNVQYFSSVERAQHEIFPRSGKFYDVNGRELNSAFDAEAFSFEDALLAIDKDFRMYVLSGEERGRLHHSSLSAGGDVLFAGTIAFMDGRVRHMSDSSGHYKPEPWRTRRVVRLMRDRGADLSQMRLSGHVATEYGGSVSLTAAQVQKFILANP